MALDPPELLRSEFAGLAQDVIGNPQLADVVYQRPCHHGVQFGSENGRMVLTPEVAPTAIG